MNIPVANSRIMNTVLKPFGWIRGLYDWVVGLAKRPNSGRALFGIAFAESSFFPIPPDILLIPLGIGDPKKALRFAGICTIGSLLGALLGDLFFLPAVITFVRPRIPFLKNSGGEGVKRE